MCEYPLHFRNGHLFVELDGTRWLLDTGAPSSFGALDSLSVAGEEFHLDDNFLGLTVGKLTEAIGVDCKGLLGADVLGRFDLLLDVPRNTVTITAAELVHAGQPVELTEFMGIPILVAVIGGAEHKMFFDTGAQISYFQGESLTDFPPGGVVTDFYPGFGRFQTETHDVQVDVGGTPFTLRCGSLPQLLAASLMMADVSGIIGNELVLDRVVGYFPRRHLLLL